MKKTHSTARRRRSIATMALFAGCNKQKKSPQTMDMDMPGKTRQGRNRSRASLARPRKRHSSGVKCAAHDAPKELCFICDASRREKGRLWCEDTSATRPVLDCHPNSRTRTGHGVGIPFTRMVLPHHPNCGAGQDRCSLRGGADVRRAWRAPKRSAPCASPTSRPSCDPARA